MESLLVDIRQSLRLMRKSPGFTAVAVSALALGIGANTAIFSVVDKVLLSPLPYAEPDRMVSLNRKFPNGVGGAVSIPKYMAWRQNDVFSAMALYDQSGPGLNLGGAGRPQQVKGAHVSADYFKVFGVNPMLGRTFTASEDAPNGPKAAIIGEKLWRSHFASDPAILNRAITLNSESYPVVGIIPDSFVANPEVWIPLQADPNSVNQGNYLQAAARLKPGVSMERARAEMRAAGDAFRRANPIWMEKLESVAVTPMRDSVVRDVKPALLVLLGAVAFVLLIACANVANLLLARAASRQRELAIRAALGASRWRVIRQLLTESVILSGCGGLLGFVLGVWGVRALLLLVPGNIPRLDDPAKVQGLFTLLDWRMVGFTIAVSFVTGILFGLFPALQISNPDVASTLKEASGRSVTGRKQNRIRKVLVGTEMALALVLLVSAALLIRTFVGLSTVDPGIDPHHVLTMQTSLAGGRYSSTAKENEFAVRALRRIENMPGVEAAAASIALPIEGQVDLPFNIAGRTPKKGNLYDGEEQWRSVTPHYLAVYKIPLLRGRFVQDTDSAAAAKIVVINQAMAKKYWPKEDPIGQVITIGKGLGPQFADLPRQIAGIVGDAHEAGLGDTNVGAMYVPQSQQPEGLTQLANAVLPLSWSVRSHLDRNSLSALVLREIQAIDGQMPIARVRSMEQILSESTSRQNFNMLLLSIFAGIALLLAAIGIYGLMSYAVEQQTQEFGIRMALGADSHALLRLILKQGMTPALLGVGAGLAIAFGVTRLLGSLLYGVKPTDPASFAVVAITLTAVALAATYLPARRAANVDPIVALREE